MKYPVALLLAIAAGSADAAGPIYRCGPDGRQFSQAPCAGGTLVESSDPRSGAQRAEAKRVAALERKQADNMERERKARQAAEKPALATSIGVRPVEEARPAASAAETSGRKKRHGKFPAETSKDVIAVEPAKPKKAKQP